MPLKPNRLIALSTVLLAAASLHAQSSSDALQGALVFPAGSQPTTSAHVWVYEERTLAHYEAHPNPDGKFSVNLPPGIYAVFVSAPGFVPFAQSVSIKADDRLSIKIALAVDTENPLPPE